MSTCPHGIDRPASCADCHNARRDAFAAAALNGAVAHCLMEQDAGWPDWHHVAVQCRKAADALIAALDKPVQP